MGVLIIRIGFWDTVYYSSVEAIKGRALPVIPEPYITVLGCASFRALNILDPMVWSPSGLGFRACVRLRAWGLRRLVIFETLGQRPCRIP